MKVITTTVIYFLAPIGLCLPVSNLRLGLDARGINVAGLRTVGQAGRNAIAAGIASSGRYGAKAASVGALNTAEAIVGFGAGAAGVPLVTYKLYDAARDGLFEGVAGPNTAVGKAAKAVSDWDTERMKNGEHRKKALIHGAQKAAGWFQDKFIPGAKDPMRASSRRTDLNASKGSSNNCGLWFTERRITGRDTCMYGTS